MNRLGVVLLLALVGVAVAGDMMRKAIVFDKATPEVFYCPIDKPTSFEKMYVRSRPLDKLCEFDGKGLPSDYKSDCYNDVDESEYACKEKKRIMIRRETEEMERELLQTTTPAANNRV
ncbi:uncharacterized protein LOC126996529 isoform X2 [Eriocheir sinensis]|uniref:uncharacterized protein LOC126996529 isoform X2 n=1 Tax=Eriocheir sinensis TaxID=95602 RepID=UPI0021C96E86|nr:uncharacterized protein LOC126996529 isoform X2 [Eriocheir sinensis]